MIGMKIDQAKGQFFDRKAVQDATSKAERKVLSRFGAFVRTRAKSSIRTRKKPSAPGSPPSSHLGLLKKFIFFVYERARHSVIIGPARLNQLGNAPEALEKGGESEVLDVVGGQRKRRRVRIRPRPYMGPAFDAELARMPEGWRYTIKR